MEGTAKRVRVDEHVNGAPSFFDNVPMAPPDPIFNVAQSFKNDPHPDKINLGVGAYRTEEGKPWVLPVVKKAEHAIEEDEALDHEYLPIDGLKTFNTAMATLILGKDSPALSDGRVAAVQCLSGTGALRVAADFLKRHHSSDVIYVSDPTWGNHISIFQDAGLKVHKYRYYKADTCGFDFEGMMEDLKQAPSNAIILLHACAHNPTGVDPSPEQWAAIADLMQAQQLFPFFDCAYQGFVTGDLEKDAAAVRMFERRGMELLVCQSCSKNFGLYNERSGCLTIVCKRKEEVDIVVSQLKVVVRPMYSNPPAHGALVVAKILNDEGLMTEWLDNLKTMSGRIFAMRQALYNALKAQCTPGRWEHILEHNGMFTYTGLTPAQCEHLTKQHHVYLLKSGRISMCGINTKNVERLAAAIHDAVTNVK